MSIELVGLAYDRSLTNAIWSRVSTREAYFMILEDEFRRKVDLRSLLYHKGHVELLAGLESFLKQGGETLTLVELIAKRFKAGVEEFPAVVGELAFDFQLIRHFSSLAMVDDFLVADPFLRELLRKIGFLHNGAAWSLLEVRDFDGVASALRDVRMQDIFDVANTVTTSSPGIEYENLVGNYIEFLSYARNNKLTPFFYNSQSDFRRWGDLAERKNSRNELVVDLSMAPGAKVARRKADPSKLSLTSTPKTLEERMKVRRESDALLEGLRDSDPLIRQKAAESLGRLADLETLPHLIKILHDEEPEVRQEIVRAIGRFANDQGMIALLDIAGHDQVASVRLTAAHVLQQRKVKEAIPVLFDAVEEGLPHFAVLLAYHPAFTTDRTAQKKVKLLAASENPTVRREAAFLFGRLEGRAVVDSLLELVNDSDEETRCNALYSLYEVAPKDALAVATKFRSHASEATARAGTIVKAWKSSKRH